MSLTAFVTGASGFVGSHLVKELHARDWKVHVLVRPTSSLDEISAHPVTVHTGDVTDREGLMAAMPPESGRGVSCCCKHQFLVEEQYRTGSRQYRWDREHGKGRNRAGARRFVHTSSFVTWGFGNKLISEQSERSPASDWINYVRSKHLAEQVVLKAVKDQRLDAVILNPAHILGPGDQHNWSRMIRMVEKGKLFAAPPGSGNFGDVRQIARAHIEAFHSGRRGEKYLLGGEYAAFADLIRITGEVLGR